MRRTTHTLTPTHDCRFVDYWTSTGFHSLVRCESRSEARREYEEWCESFYRGRTTTVSDELTIITNNHERLLIDACELTEKGRAEFDYLNWEKIDAGEDSATFIRYRGVTYDLGEFMTTSGMPEFSPLRRWHGYHSDSFFSGVLVRVCEDNDYVVMGRFYS